ncbi:hypothetical protein D3C73_776380 [compost metagenome]
MPNATRKILADSSIPNHRITSGINARCGTLRIICTELSSRRSPQRDRPVIKPSASPMLPPMLKPINARQLLMVRCCHSSPLLVRVHKAVTTALGAGRMRFDSQPASTDICQTATSATGNAQGANRCKIRCVPFAIVRLLSFAMLFVEYKYWPPLRPVLWLVGVVRALGFPPDQDVGTAVRQRDRPLPDAGNRTK